MAEAPPTEKRMYTEFTTEGNKTQQSGYRASRIQLTSEERETKLASSTHTQVTRNQNTQCTSVNFGHNNQLCL